MPQNNFYVEKRTTLVQLQSYTLVICDINYSAYQAGTKLHHLQLENCTMLLSVATWMLN